MTNEFVHNNLYSEALKIAAKFTATTQSRPVLTYVRHDLEGSLQATDSHRAIIIKDMHGFKEEYLIHPKSFTAMRGNYPDLKQQFVMGEGCMEMIKLPKEQLLLWFQMFKSINQTLVTLKTFQKCVTMTFLDDGVEISIAPENIKFSLPCERPLKSELKKISFNAQYMRDALEAHVKLESEVASMWFSGSMKPFFINDKNGKVNVIVLPIRTYENNIANFEVMTGMDR